MTITESDRTIVRMMSHEEMRQEIDRLLDRVGMTRDDLGAAGEAFELDAAQRSVLADVEALEWMLSR